MMSPSTLILIDDGIFPNNKALPALLYKSALEPSPEEFERVFRTNTWIGSWRNGVYSFHHYHSEAHEVLGVYAGSAVVMLGGESGETVHLEAGDVVVIPAGVAHKKISSSGDFAVVGAYPKGQSPDMQYGKTGERPLADEKIAAAPLPTMDPIYGAEVGIVALWR